MKPFRTAVDRIKQLDAESQWNHDTMLLKSLKVGLPSSFRYNISISHSKRFLWFRVAKVGTRSIFYHFQQNGVALDVVEAMWIHYPAAWLHKYFKFAFVRDPWDRLISCWRDKVVQRNYFRFEKSTREKMMDFGCFLGWVKQQDLANCDHHLCRQSRLIDLAQLDFLGRMERFESDFQLLCRELDLSTTTIPHQNQSQATLNSQSANLKDLYGEQVAALYRLDYQVFGYSY